MFNDFPQSDDVEVIQFSIGNPSVSLSEDCKSNIILVSPSTGTFSALELPNFAFVGKVISITHMSNVAGTGKTPYAAQMDIKHSNTTLFTLKQGTVSFMYVGQQLNGLTATDKSKSGWIILGGVQGDTAITGYAGSVAIGSGAYCGDTNITVIGRNSYSTLAGAVVLGYNSTNTAYYGTVLGSDSSVTAENGVAIGRYTKTFSSKIGLKANTIFSANGDAQAGKFILMRQTTDATPLVMSATNAAASTTNILILPNNGTYAFKGIVVAKDASTLDSAMWEVTALMRRGANASTTTLVGTPTVTKVFNDAGAAAWTIALTADTTNGGGTITVTGEAGKTIRWVSNIDSAEVI